MGEIELAFALQAIKDVEFYALCSGHIRRSELSNTLPCFRFDIRTLLRDLDIPEGAEESVDDFVRKWFDNFGEINEGLEFDFNIFTDMNGYRILADIPLYYHLELRERLLKDLESYPEFKDETKEELEECEERLIECASQFKQFEEWFKRFERYWEQEVKDLKFFEKEVSNKIFMLDFESPDEDWKVVGNEVE